jgi:hypothetical protein
MVYQVLQCAFFGAGAWGITQKPTVTKEGYYLQLRYPNKITVRCL